MRTDPWERMLGPQGGIRPNVTGGTVLFIKRASWSGLTQWIIEHIIVTYSFICCAYSSSCFLKAGIITICTCKTIKAFLTKYHSFRDQIPMTAPDSSNQSKGQLSTGVCMCPVGGLPKSSHCCQSPMSQAKIQSEEIYM